MLCPWTQLRAPARSQNLRWKVIIPAFSIIKLLVQAEYHLKYILKMETGCEEGSSSRAHFLDLITEMANRYILKKDMKVQTHNPPI